MRENVRVIIWGFGAMGSGMADMLLSKKGVDIILVLWYNTFTYLIFHGCTNTMKILFTKKSLCRQRQGLFYLCKAPRHIASLIY